MQYICGQTIKESCVAQSRYDHSYIYCYARGIVDNLSLLLNWVIVTINDLLVIGMKRPF